jgi:hypothetical protein
MTFLKNFTEFVLVILLLIMDHERADRHYFQIVRITIRLSSETLINV